MLHLLSASNNNVHNDVGSHNRHRPQVYYPYMHTLKYKVDEMPMRLDRISAFERMNPELSVNVIKYNRVNPANMVDEIEAEEEDDCGVYKNPHFDLVYKSR